MTQDERTASESNLAVMRGFYDALTPNAEGLMTTEALATVVNMFQNEREIELNLGHPYGGVFVGPTEIAVARHRLHELAGYGQSDHSAFEYIANGPTRVVVYARNNGTDLAGNPWSMKIVEVNDIVDGHIVKKRTFFEDPARLRDIMVEREAALKERLLNEYWRSSNNPLLAPSNWAAPEGHDGSHSS